MQEVAAALGLADFGVLMAGSLPDVRVENPNAALLAYLRDVGTTLLEQHGNAQPAVNAMGGGGETGLVVGMFNAPTCLPAALWCSGVIEGTPWRPLVLRRGYQGSFHVC